MQNLINGDMISYPSVSAIPAGFVGTCRVGTDLYVGDGGAVATVKKNGSGGRPTVLIFGCSIAGLQQRRMAGGTTNLAYPDSPAGSTTLTLGDATGFTSGSKIAVELGGRQPFFTTQVGAPVGNVITIADRLPMHATAYNCYVFKYTTDRPQYVRMGQSYITQALQLLGMPVEILNGYGEIGATSEQIVPHLPMYLNKFNPNYCMLFITENDLSNGLSETNLIRRINAAVQMCINNGTIPIVFSSVPANVYSAASGLVPKVLTVLNYIKNISAYYPQAIGVDSTTLWTDNTYPTNVFPIAGWTDGIHPVPGRSITMGLYFKSLFQKMFGSRASHSDISQYYYGFSGSGGALPSYTTGNIATGLSLTPTAATGLAIVCSKIAGTDKQKIIATTTSTALQVLFTVDTGALTIDAHLYRRWIKIYCKFLLNSKTNLQDIQLSGFWSDGTQFNVMNEQNAGGGTTYQDTGNDTAWAGNETTQESCAIMVPAGVTSLTIKSTVVVDAGTGSAINIEYRELGFMMAASGELFDTV